MGQKEVNNAPGDDDDGDFNDYEEEDLLPDMTAR